MSKQSISQTNQAITRTHYPKVRIEASEWEFKLRVQIKSGIITVQCINLFIEGFRVISKEYLSVTRVCSVQNVVRCDEIGTGN